MPEVDPQFWWYLARASGFVAWGASVLAVLLGLALATRALGNRPRPAWLLDLHRFVGGLSVVVVGVHLGALVADSYVEFDIVDLLVPFASEWRSGAVAWGVLAFWFLVLVEGSSLLMRRLPRRIWRAIHLTSYVVAGASSVHALTAGTDAGNPGAVALALVTPAATAFFLVYRAIGPTRRRGGAARRRAPQGGNEGRPADAERATVAVT